MCAIAGLVNFDLQHVNAGALQEMLTTIRHRGSDGTGQFVNEHVGLGHNRLAIRDLSHHGQQPMVDARGEIVTVFNGEIYNYYSLKMELQNRFAVDFHSNCDAEIWPHGYRYFGDSLFEKIEGMYAVAIWDARSGELILARDRLGIKPLFYKYTDSCVTFASEVKALSINQSDTKLSAQAVVHFLANGYTSPGETLLADVRQVKQGTLMRFGRSKPVEQRFWCFQRGGADFVEQPVDDLLDEFNQTFTEVLADHMQSDVPIAVLQSGGVDSSLISMSFQGLSEKVRPDLYSLSFEQADYDEFADAEKIARLTGYPLHKVPFSPEVDWEQDFKRVVYYSDGQIADSSMLPFYHLMKAISKRYKVALSGDGADELFAGYPTYKATHLARCCELFLPNVLTQWVAKGLGRLVLDENKRLSNVDVARRFLEGVCHPFPHGQWRRLFGERILQRVVRKNVLSNTSLPWKDYQNSATWQSSLLDNSIMSDVNYYLPADMLVKVDRMSMAHGVEVRVPFLDGRIVSFSQKLSSSLLMGVAKSTKPFLRKALRQKATRAIAERKKTGFNIPVSRLLRNELKSLGEQLLVKEVDLLADLLNPDVVTDMWRQHQLRKRDFGYELWALMTLYQWNKTIGGGHSQ